MKKLLLGLLGLFALVLCLNSCKENKHPAVSIPESRLWEIQQSEDKSQLTIHEAGKSQALLVHKLQPDQRPFIHTLKLGSTEIFQGKNQSNTQEGLFWGFSKLNDRNYLKESGPQYWKKVSSEIVQAKGKEVSWKCVYDYLDEKGQAILRGTQKWSLEEKAGKMMLGFEWEGEAMEALEIGSSEIDGLFLSSNPAHGHIVNAVRQRNELANGKRAMWIDLGLQEEKEQAVHIALLDHPANAGFPQVWAVADHGVGTANMSKGTKKMNKGESLLYQHQVLLYPGKLDDVAMTEDWKNFIGDNGMYAGAVMWNIAREEGRNAKFLTAQEAVDEMTIKEGYQVNAWASEPMITQPMAFCWDDKGRLWVAENRDYEDRKSGFSNYGNSRILIIEDTDHDGIADSKKVFLEGIPFPSAIAVGFDGLYLGAPPNLLFIPDANKDDVADMEDVKVLRTGWGIRDRHETLNSLHWGPDGWLYGLEGFATPSKIRKPVGKGKLYKHKEPFPADLLEAEGVDIDGGVWRYHPTKDIFEVVSHGFSNPWGVDYDSKGQMFISACVIPHMFHIIPGGIFHRQGGQHFNPYVYQDIRTIVDHRHRSAHGGARIYQSDAFPRDQKGLLFMANIHEHGVLTDKLTPKGSGFVASHGEDFMMANNAQWIGFSMEIGPDGNVYVLDWHDADICGNSVQNKETGRIFRISPEKSRAREWEGRYGDLEQLNDEQLADLQLSESDWHARRARVILQHRASKGEISKEALHKLRDMYHKNSLEDLRLRAMWTLHVIQGFEADDLEEALNDKDEYVRAWAIQLLCEDKNPEEKYLKRFEEMAEVDLSAVVRLYLASAMQRIPAKNTWNLAEALLSRDIDIEDHNIPLMTWFGLEAVLMDDVDRALKLARGSQNPLLSEFIVRRLSDGDETEEVVASLSMDSPNKMAMLQGLQKALDGRVDVEEPQNWAAVYEGLKSHEEYADQAQDIARLFGSAEAAKSFFTTLQDKGAPIADRRKAINGLAKQKWPELLPALPALLEEEALRVEAIRAAGQYNQYQLGLKLLSLYDSFSTEEKTAAIQTLSARKTYANLLTKALKEKEIPRKDIPAYTARQLRRVLGNGFVEVWGPIDQLASNTESEIARYKSMLTNQVLAAASSNNGQKLFQANCGACHILSGEGGNIGPDLTGANRKDIDYLLYNILDPSGDIQDSYKMLVVTSRDGRTYLGNRASENEKQLVLRIVGEEEVIINKSDIQSREGTEVSLMPQALLQPLSDKEVADLMSYLMTAEAEGEAAH